ncbi:MAG: BTAD domain-containing putative transcriptional regulator [Saprospiraceae bacterium]
MTPPRIVIIGKANLHFDPALLPDIQHMEFAAVPEKYPLERLDYLAPFHMVVLDAATESEPTLERIRTFRRLYPFLPLILTAGNPSPSYLVQAYRNGLTDCLLTPLSKEQFGTMVLTYVKADQPCQQNHTLHFLPSTALLGWKPAAIDMNADISTCFLGTFRLFQKGRRVDLPGGTRQRSLLAYLFFHAPSNIHRDKIIRWFWPDHDPDCAKNNLNVAICNLRKFFEKHISKDVICFQNDYFFINPDLQLYSDTSAFTEAFYQGKEWERRGKTEKAAHWYQMAAQLGTEFLEEFQQEDWAVWPREEFTEKYFHALDVLSTYQLESRQYDAALETLRGLLYKDDCLEFVHYKIMNCYLALGKKEKAVRQFHECERILQEKLNMRPSSETEALYQAAAGIRRA